MIGEGNILNDGVNSMWLDVVKKDEKWKIPGKGKVVHMDWAAGQPNKDVSKNICF